MWKYLKQIDINVSFVQNSQKHWFMFSPQPTTLIYAFYYIKAQAQNVIVHPCEVSYIMGATSTPYHQKGKMQNLLDFLSPNWKAFNVELVCTTWIFIELENCWYSQVNQHRCGSKRHAMSQFGYFEFRIIILFRVIFPKKHVFLKRNFQMKCFEPFYILYL